MLLLAKLLKALSSDASPWQLALGIMFGMIFGLTPLLGLHNLLILFIVLFFRINLSTFLLAFPLFSGLGYVLAPLMSKMGESLLTLEGLNSIWTALYNTGFGRLSQFFHTLTLGSLITAIVLAPVVLIISKILIIQYREKLMAHIEKFKIIQLLKSSKLYRLYQGLGGIKP
ncbi:TIGR03546 family protein [Thalassomonas haliotis]|uniref:TIGR03546 family protein n=1 Tax=Thalassomonas haliotis TaxID=485448 RepID=A0ABY7VLY5_9GAMM|nr:TIGR03546 family protein [Thalassomonas haliotis]WDE13677.1 TIGR03546 family protein [Thalassomonas haliotis]